MIRRALNSVPARPAVVVGAVLLVAALGYHYGSSYSRCTHHADSRQRLKAAIEAAASRTTGSVRLADITDFRWDKVTIVAGYRPDGRTPDCPFGWDWSTETRAALAGKGLLTLLVFSRRGAVADYIEYRSDWAAFEGLKNPYTPATAVFVVERRSPTDRFVLRPAKPAR